MEISENKKRIMHPLQIGVQTCGLVLLSNLAEVEYVSVNCSCQLLRSVICLVSSNKTDVLHFRNQSENKRQMFCLSDQLLKNKQCIFFAWSSNGTSSAPHSPGLVPLAVSDVWSLFFLFYGVSTDVQPLLFPFPENVSVGSMFWCRKYKNIYVYHNRSVKLDRTEGFLVYASARERFLSEDMVFECSSGEFISVMHSCDGIIDCLNDNSDEANCQFLLPIKNDSLRNGTKLVCPTLYYTTADGACHKFSDEKARTHSTETKPSFKCKAGREIDRDNIDDLVVDCGLDAEDESMLKSLLLYNKKGSCENSSHIPCVSGHTRCFAITDICHYNLDDVAKVYPCRNGNHMEKCDDFECSVRFKCTNSYCGRTCVMGGGTVHMVKKNINKCVKTTMCVQIC